MQAREGLKKSQMTDLLNDGTMSIDIVPARSEAVAIRRKRRVRKIIPEGGNKKMIQEALNIAYSYLRGHYGDAVAAGLKKDLIDVAGLGKFTFEKTEKYKDCTYDRIQEILSKLNEKEAIRKTKGVYYTPGDVVDFILRSSVKACYGKLKQENIADSSLSEVPWKSFGTKAKVFDPTCGSGEYLLKAMEWKIELLQKNGRHAISKALIRKVAGTVYGNDINEESVAITKIRILLCLSEKTDAKKCRGIGECLNGCFYTKDFVSEFPDIKEGFDIIIGNPPYVEDSKCGLKLQEKYGNIYANVLKHGALLLKPGGALGFIIPLSYVSTERMKGIRKDLLSMLPEQYILSYADRPDCLFDSVHQKLNILIAKNKKCRVSIYTGNYQYWYEEERPGLFSGTKVIRNAYGSEVGIPKFGTEHDIEIFKKVMGPDTASVYDISREGAESVYLNRRETFWMKAFRTRVDDPEYKVFSFRSAGEADYCYCLINSSLFWWYWVCMSDCWHVSKKLNGFRAPIVTEYDRASVLAGQLARRLEETKVYVGTKQTDYEYKHNKCIKEIRAIDDFVNEIYGLAEDESKYIKEFAFRYRISGGV